MKILTSKSDLMSWRRRLSDLETVVGFVPTMGALHEGHLSLVYQALEQNEVVVVSIFVNPTQFNNLDDLETYPRTLEADVTLLQTLSTDRIVVFAPSAHDLYDGTPKSKSWDFGPVSRVMEGAFRTGHFDGVGTVLQLLFEAVNPMKSYFGEKDYQQLQIVKQLTAQLGQNNEIIGCSIYREPSGLAMSSRNQRLTDVQKSQAPLIYRVLTFIKDHISSMSWSDLVLWAEEQFESDLGWRLEYLTLADAHSLESKDHYVETEPLRVFIAVHLGCVRLIDNLDLN